MSDDQIVMWRNRACHAPSGMHAVFAHLQAMRLQALYKGVLQHCLQLPGARCSADAIRELHELAKSFAAGSAGEQMFLQLALAACIQLAEPIGDECEERSRGCTFESAHASSPALMQRRSRSTPRWRITRTLPADVPSAAATSSAGRSS